MILSVGMLVPQEMVAVSKASWSWTTTVVVQEVEPAQFVPVIVRLVLPMGKSKELPFAGVLKVRDGVGPLPAEGVMRARQCLLHDFLPDFGSSINFEHTFLLFSR